MLLGTEYMIVFKAKAWLDLSVKKKSGIHVDERDIKKHKNDIARLATIIEGNTIPFMPEEVRIDMNQFITLYKESPVDLNALRIKNTTNEEILGRLKKIIGE